MATGILTDTKVLRLSFKTIKKLNFTDSLLGAEHRKDTHILYACYSLYKYQYFNPLSISLYQKYSGQPDLN